MWGREEISIHSAKWLYFLLQVSIQAFFMEWLWAARALPDAPCMAVKFMQSVDFLNFKYVLLYFNSYLHSAIFLSKINCFID